MTVAVEAAITSRVWEPRPDAFLGPAPGTRDAEAVAREFAGLFYSMMIKEMQKTVPENSYFGGRGEEVFRSLWCDQLGRKMAAGVGDPLSRAVLKSYAKSTAVTAAPGGDNR